MRQFSLCSQIDDFFVVTIILVVIVFIGRQIIHRRTRRGHLNEILPFSRGDFRLGDDTDHGNMDGRASSLMYRRPFRVKRKSESLKCSEQILVRLVNLKSFEASLRIFTSQVCKGFGNGICLHLPSNRQMNTIVGSSIKCLQPLRIS